MSIRPKIIYTKSDDYDGAEPLTKAALNNVRSGFNDFLRIDRELDRYIKTWVHALRPETCELLKRELQAFSIEKRKWTDAMEVAVTSEPDEKEAV